MAHRSSSSIQVAVTTDNQVVNPGFPAGYASTDFLVALVSTYPLSYDFTPSSGAWTLLYSGTGVAVYTAPGTAPSSSFVRGTAGSRSASIAISAFTGRNLSAAITASAFLNDGGTGPATAVASAVTAAAGDDIYVGYATNIPASATPPTDYTDRVLIVDGPNIAVSTRDNVSAGTTGTITHPLTGGYSTNLMATLAIAQSAGPPPNWTISSPTVDSDAGTVTSVLTLDAPAPAGGVSGFFSTYDITATAGADYTARTGVVISIPEGDTSANLTIPILP